MREMASPYERTCTLQIRCWSVEMFSSREWTMFFFVRSRKLSYVVAGFENFLIMLTVSSLQTLKIYRGLNWKSYSQNVRGELSYLAPLGSENISAPYFKQCFFRGVGGGVSPPQTESNTTPPSPKTEITNILFYILNFASIIKFKM